MKDMLQRTLSGDPDAAKRFLVRYGIILAIIDAILSALIATLNAILLGAQGLFGAGGTAISWILTAVFSFLAIGNIMVVASFIIGAVMSLIFELKREGKSTPATGSDTSVRE